MQTCVFQVFVHFISPVLIGGVFLADASITSPQQNYLFSLSKTTFSGSKYPEEKKNENRSTGRHPVLRSCRVWEIDHIKMSNFASRCRTSTKMKEDVVTMKSQCAHLSLEPGSDHWF